MATEFSILHLQFKLPEPFSHETEVFRFEENPFGAGRRLEIVAGESETGGTIASRFQKRLERSFENVTPVEDREWDGHRVLRAGAESSSGDPVQALTARTFGQSGIPLRFLSVGDGLGKIWQSTLDSVREEKKGHHGWLKDKSRRYQVNGVSLEVPEDWQDTTKYLLVIGSPSDPALEANIEWEAEPNHTPQERIRPFLRRLQAGDRSVKIRDDRSLKIDDHPAYYGSLTATELGSRVRVDFVAVKTGQEHGALFRASGLKKAFSKYNDRWEKLISTIKILT